LTTRIFAKLIFAVVCVLIVASIAVDLLASRVAESAYIDTLRQELARKGRILSSVANVARGDARRLAGYAAARLTLIAPSGTVLADSEADPAHMENHRARPEVMAALDGREGWSIRQSPTVGEKFLYVAVPAPEGALRLAVPLTEIRARVDGIRRRMLMAIALAFLPAIFVAAVFARRVSSKLGAIIAYAGELTKGNFKAHLNAAGEDELGVLGRQLSQMAGQLEKNVAELQHERSELEKLERVRKDFVINVSHELRTPVASIQGYAETLLEGALEDPAHNVRFLTIIRHNAERLGRIIGDLMTLSRLELKSDRLESTCCNLHTLLSDGVDSMQPLAARKRIALTLEAVEPALEVHCDSESVQQVLGNLLDNALKYTPEGGSIAVGAARDSGGMAEIYVRDTGAGIPREELPRLFERFYRVDKARSRELGGTGLGLSIVKHLVRAQGGDVRVESEPGKGSTFYFTLPAWQPAP
jgi:signal transduction histidine kinase